MQNLEGVPARSSQVERKSNKAAKAEDQVPNQQDQLKEQKEPLIAAANLPGMVSISYMAGSIPKDEMMRFKKLVFRATRGKALTYFEDLSTDGRIDYAGVADRRLRTVYVIVF